MPNRIVTHEELRKMAGPVSPTYWAKSKPIGARAPKPTFAKPAKPTGTYPRHFWSTGPGVGFGAQAVANAHAGIMPALPTGLPAYTPPK